MSANNRRVAADDETQNTIRSEEGDVRMQCERDRRVDGVSKGNVTVIVSGAHRIHFVLSSCILSFIICWNYIAHCD